MPEHTTGEKEPVKPGLAFLLAGLLYSGKKDGRAVIKGKNIGLNFAKPRKKTVLFGALAATLISIALAGTISVANMIDSSNKKWSSYIDKINAETAPLDKFVSQLEKLSEINDSCNRVRDFLKISNRESKSVAKPVNAIRKLLPDRAKLLSINYCCDMPVDQGSNGCDAWARSIIAQIEGDFTGNGTVNLLDFIGSLNKTGYFQEVYFNTNSASKSSEQDKVMNEIIDMELVLR